MSKAVFRPVISNSPLALVCATTSIGLLAATSALIEKYVAKLAASTGVASPLSLDGTEKGAPILSFVCGILLGSVGYLLFRRITASWGTDQLSESRRRQAALLQWLVFVGILVVISASFFGVSFFFGYGNIPGAFTAMASFIFPRAVSEYKLINKRLASSSISTIERRLQFLLTGNAIAFYLIALYVLYTTVWLLYVAAPFFVR